MTALAWWAITAPFRFAGRITVALARILWADPDPQAAETVADSSRVTALHGKGHAGSYDALSAPRGPIPTRPTPEPPTSQPTKVANR